MEGDLRVTGGEARQARRGKRVGPSGGSWGFRFRWGQQRGKYMDTVTLLIKERVRLTWRGRGHCSTPRTKLRTIVFGQHVESKRHVDGSKFMKNSCANQLRRERWVQNMIPALQWEGPNAGVLHRCFLPM